MPGFEWATVRVVPRVERGEYVNVGVLVYCRALDYLEAAVELDTARLLALAPDLDVQTVGRHLESFADLCGGHGKVPANVARSRGERFRWLTAPRSTVVQTSPIHTGLTTDPAAELDRLMDVMVRPREAGP